MLVEVQLNLEVTRTPGSNDGYVEYLSDQETEFD